MCEEWATHVQKPKVYFQGPSYRSDQGVCTVERERGGGTPLANWAGEGAGVLHPLPPGKKAISSLTIKPFI